MRMRELIDIINIYDVKIIFDKIDIKKKQKPIYFTPLEGKEREIYDNLEDKHNFVSTYPSIHILDLSVEDFVNIFECEVTGIYEYTIGIIEGYNRDGVDDSIVYAIFVFLHEIGHWKQFEIMERNVSTYIKQYSELYDKNHNELNLLAEQYMKRIQRENSHALTVNERELFNKCMIEYRNIPREKEADEFALNQIQIALNLYMDFVK